MNKHLHTLLTGILLCWWCAGNGMASTPSDDELSVIAYPLPQSVAQTRQPVICLNGDWQFKFSDKHPWTSIRVPGEAAMQGFAIEHDRPFYYRKQFTVPADFAGKRIILRFDGVYSHAVLSVNGQKIREHHGGFTRWETDITPYVKTGKKNNLQLQVTDRLDDISYAAGYAHHPIGGILRDVTLFALPSSHLYDVAIETELDTLYRDARLHFGCSYQGAAGSQLCLRLKDAKGRTVSDQRLALQAGSNRYTLDVQRPQKWDAEHPYLYTLEVSLCGADTKELTRFERHIGFRKVEVVKDRMLVNGQPVKLRGACRHDIHPTLGRTTTRELDSLDVQLFKQSNMNFVRTSHYPPNERFLDFCDRYGIYVESETAVCFVNTYRQKNYAPGATQDDPLFRNRYLGQCQEMVKHTRNHASIVLWSIGNESVYGSNFQASWDWVKAADTTRPVIFSYPGSAEEKKARIFDVLSMHYQDVNGNIYQWGMTTRNFQGHGLPVLYDEWAHPACYTYATLQDDPNIREFWGQSLDKMWSGLFEARGGLGGAIWGYIDETFALPVPHTGTPYWQEFAHTAKPEGFRGNCVGYGEWGIVDVWRRHKPEFWATKKAYSPVRLLTVGELDYSSGLPLQLTVYNRFDHTDLNELTATFTYQGNTAPLALPSLQPHQKGRIEVPARPWAEGEQVGVAFYTAQGELVDEYRLTLGKAAVELPALAAGTTLRTDDNGTTLTVRGDGFEIPFSRADGLITNARAGDRLLIEKGPFLHLYINLNHLSGAEIRKIASFIQTQEEDWQKTSFEWRTEGHDVRVTTVGTYRDIQVRFDFRITPRGELTVSYVTQGAPNGFLRESGIDFRLPDGFQELAWRRKGYWDYYPAGEMAGNEGRVSLYRSRQSAYGEPPVQPWADDTHNYYYWADAGANCRQPLTQAAKGRKENIWWYTLSFGDGSDHRLSVVSPSASTSCRLQKRPDEQLHLYVDNRWDYPEIAWGNYCKVLEAVPCYGTLFLNLK